VNVKEDEDSLEVCKVPKHAKAAAKTATVILFSKTLSLCLTYLFLFGGWAVGACSSLDEATKDYPFNLSEVTIPTVVLKACARDLTEAVIEPKPYP
jgi:hypothetical protein